MFNEPAEAGTEFVAVRVRVRSIGTGDPNSSQNVDGSWINLCPLCLCGAIFPVFTE